MRCKTFIPCAGFVFSYLAICNVVYAQQREPEYFTKTEIKAAYPKGMNGWFDFVEHNFNFSSLPKSGKTDLRITLWFVVLKTGKIHEIYFLSGDPLLLKPASDLLSKSGNWRPAIQGGREVSAYRGLSMRFRFNKERNKWEFVRDKAHYETLEPLIFTKTEIIASYISYNEKHWFDFVEREFNFEKLPASGVSDSLEVLVGFVSLRYYGRIMSIFRISGDWILFDPVYDLLLKSFGKWDPAKQGGTDVNSYRRIRLRFKFNKDLGKWEFVRNKKDYMIFPGDR